jgi:hypothetical protein
MGFVWFSLGKVVISLNGINQSIFVMVKFAVLFGHGAHNPTLEKTLDTKSEEAMAGYFSWQKLLRKARTHVGLSSRR